MELYELMNFCNGVIKKLEESEVALTDTVRTDIPRAAIDRVQAAFTNMHDELRTFKEAYGCPVDPDTANSTLATWTGDELHKDGITWVEHPQGGAIDAKMLNGAWAISDGDAKNWTWIDEMSAITLNNFGQMQINPDDAVVAAWDHDRKIATIELKDGSRVTYTSEESVAKTWNPELGKKLRVDTRPDHPSNFAAMYNYVKFNVLPGGEVIDKTPASETSADPHEGMVQGYDGQWRWL